MLLTTTPSIEGHPIREYRGIISAETIIGANFVKDFFARFTDVFGGRSGSYERVLREGKEAALAELTKEAQRLGANAVVLFNRYYRPDIDIERCRIVAAPPFSDPSELGDTLRWTAIVSGALPDMPIAASTGVHAWQDAIKCILAGASAVQLCSTLYKHGAKVIPEMITQIADWMERTKYESVEEFRGRLSLSNAADASMYERTQFMKYISSRETI